MSALISLQEAQARLFGLAEPLKIERVDAASAGGRYLAAPLIAKRTHPSCNLSAMDGYAIRSNDLRGPWNVIGESAAGHAFAGSVSDTETVRISTGAIMPADTDAVILQEDIERAGDQITLVGELPSPITRHVRRKGLDFEAGDLLLDAGTKIGPAQAALSISAGQRHLPVRQMPSVTIMETGDELCAEDRECPPDKIPSSNGVMLASLAATIPCEITRLPPVPDNLDKLVAAFKEADCADIIVTSGGASVGDHDLVRPAAELWGAKIAFWRIAMKPGKPLMVATRNNGRKTQILLGLPGNPVSTFVTAFLFLLPLLRHLLGAADPTPRRITAKLGSPLKAGSSRQEFIRATWDGSTLTPLSLQDSSALSALATSNALIERPARAPALDTGQKVHGFLIENGGIA